MQPYNPQGSLVCYEDRRAQELKAENKSAGEEGHTWVFSLSSIGYLMKSPSSSPARVFREA
jgi:hypothetical protein